LYITNVVVFYDCYSMHIGPLKPSTWDLGLS